MRRFCALLFSILLLLMCVGCSSSPAASSEVTNSVTITDANGETVTLPQDESLRVVCLYSSYAQAWLSAGGELCGVVDDAVSERSLDIGDAEIVGTVKEPNVEEILALSPDWVILSADLTAHMELQDVLQSAGLACSYFRVDTFEDYADLMEQFVSVTGREELLDETVTPAREKIEQVLETIENRQSDPNVLLLRAFSSGIKAKSTDELAGSILAELGANNLADEHPSMLEDLSLEQVILSDPEFIFVTTMGEEEKALAYLDSLIAENPAWQGLSAVQNGNYIVLPKDLFHYKPNELWGDSYEYLAKLLYPELFQ